MSETKACPFCAEQILAAATVCKHCGRDQNSLKATTSPWVIRALVAVVVVLAAWWFVRAQIDNSGDKACRQIQEINPSHNC